MADQYTTPTPTGVLSWLSQRFQPRRHRQVSTEGERVDQLNQSLDQLMHEDQLLPLDHFDTDSSWESGSATSSEQGGTPLVLEKGTEFDFINPEQNLPLMQAAKVNPVQGTTKVDAVGVGPRQGTTAEPPPVLQGEFESPEVARGSPHRRQTEGGALITGRKPTQQRKGSLDERVVNAFSGMSLQDSPAPVDQVNRVGDSLGDSMSGGVQMEHSRDGQVKEVGYVYEEEDSEKGAQNDEIATRLKDEQGSQGYVLTDGVLTQSLVDRYGLGQQVVSDLEDHLKQVIAEERHQAAKTRGQVLQAKVDKVQKQVDATVVAMHTKLEAKTKLANEHWGGQLQSVRAELEQMRLKYEQSLKEQRQLVAKSAQTTVLRKEIEQLRLEKQSLQEEIDTKLWLEVEYPRGYSDLEILSMPQVVRPIAQRLLGKQRGQPTGIGEEERVNFLPDNRAPQGKRQRPGRHPPRYTEAMGGVQGGFGNPQGGVVYTAPQGGNPPGGVVYTAPQGVNQPMYGNGPTLVSPIAGMQPLTDLTPGKGLGGRSTPKSAANSNDDLTQVCLQNMGQAIINLHRQQAQMYDQLKADLSHEISRQHDQQKVELNHQHDQKKVELGKVHNRVGNLNKAQEQAQRIAEISECIKQHEAVSGSGPQLRLPSRKEQEAEGLMLAKAASEAMLGGDYGSNSIFQANGGSHLQTPAGVRHGAVTTEGKVGPCKFQLPKHEENAVGLFHGGEEARNDWPDFYANFEHVADSYGWGEELKGVMLYRRSREHALQVIKTVPKSQKQNYKALVAAFNKAYIPSEWARTYRGVLNERKQKEGESLLQFGAALRKLALTGYPSTDPANTDEVREERCLDQFLRGISDPSVTVHVINKDPQTMEDAISAAEGYAAIFAKDESNLPLHPDQRPTNNEITAAVITPTTGGPKQPRGKPTGRKFFPKKGETKWKSKGKDRRGGWDHTNLTMEKLLKALEELSGKGIGATNSTGGGPRRFTQRSSIKKDPTGQVKPVDEFRKEMQIRCYRCQKPGHIRRECRADIYSADECALAEWYCEEHDPQRDTQEEREDF